MARAPSPHPLSLLPAAAAQAAHRLTAALVDPLARRLPSAVSPNALTGARFILGALAVAGVIRGQVRAAGLLYLAAVLTDVLDGAVARARGQVTRLGSRLDPLVDKFVHLALALLFFRNFPFLLGVLIAVDVAILLGGAVLLALNFSAGGRMSATTFGKWKVTFQAVTYLLLLAGAPRPVVGVFLLGAAAAGLLSLGQVARAVFRGPELECADGSPPHE